MNSRLLFSIDSTIEEEEKKDGENPANALHSAAAAGDISLMQSILQLDPEALDRFHSIHKTTPLCWAIENNRYLAIDLLINYNANPLLGFGTSPFYYPLSFLDTVELGLQTGYHKAILDCVISWVKAQLEQTNQLNAVTLISLYHNTLFLIEHEAVDFAAVKNILISLKKAIFESGLPDEDQAYVSLTLMLADASIIVDVIDVEEPSPDVPPPLDCASRILKEIENFPRHIKNVDLSCQLFNYANSVLDDEKECFELTSLYTLALELISENDSAFAAAIYLRKSIYHTHQYNVDDETILDDNDDEIENEEDPDNKLEELILAEALNAYNILNGMTLRNEFLAQLLQITVSDIYPISTSSDLQPLLDLLTVSKRLEPCDINQKEIQISIDLLTAYNLVINSEYSQSERHLVAALTAQQEFYIPNTSAEISYLEFVESILENMGLELIEQLPKYALSNPDQTRFCLILNNFRLSILILDYYDSITYDSAEYVEAETNCQKLLNKFRSLVLTHAQTVREYHIYLNRFLNSILESSKSLNIIAIKYTQAIFHIARDNKDVAFELFAASLIDALGSNRYEFFTKMLKEIVPIFINSNDNFSAQKITELADKFEHFRIVTSKPVVDLFFSNFTYSRGQAPWVSKIYYEAIAKVVTEKAAFSRKRSDPNCELHRHQAEYLAQVMDNLTLPPPQVSLFNRHCLFMQPYAPVVLLPDNLVPNLSGMRLS